MKRTVLSLMAMAVITGCGGGQDEGQTGGEAATVDTAATAAPAATAPAAAPATGAVTDPQIADIVVAANEVDIQAGELARTKATNPQVKEFAQRMITDHTGVNQQASQLVQRLGVTPEPSPTSQQLRQGGEQNRNNLQGQSGAAFDRAYIDHEVTYHQAVLDAIDNTLIPNAQNPELKALLQQTRPAVEAHLQHAKQIQSSLGAS
jgi:putative membrane protein